MSQITHRCRKCGKPDYWADGTTAGPTVGGLPVSGLANVARSCCRAKQWGEPELVPTYNDAGLMPNVIPPGGPAGALGAKTCNCDDCEAFYAGLAAS